MKVMGTLFVISAPSGGGKTSLVNALLAKLDNIKVSISHTTRAPRIGEENGVNYFFVNEGEFTQLEKAGHFLESANVFNNHYGTSKEWVMSQLQAGIDVILEIDWQGARDVKKQINCVGIFILPPTREILLERLQARKQDSVDVIASRMAKASEEISHYHEYDYVVVNDDFEKVLADLVAIFKAQRLRTQVQKKRHEQLLASFEA